MSVPRSISDMQMLRPFCVSRTSEPYSDILLIEIAVLKARTMEEFRVILEGVPNTPEIGK